MKIAYLDFNEDNFYEDYSIAPKHYGGGRVFAAWAKQMDNFHLYSNAKSFESFDLKDRKSNCFILSSKDRELIRLGKPIKSILPETEQYDLFVHHQSNYFINLKGLNAKSCCWMIGYKEICNKRNENVLLYNDYQSPTILNGEAKIYKIVIGKPIGIFQEYPKENFIFQCTRHLEIFGSIEVAKECLKNNIQIFFAGPIEMGYPLQSFVDNKIVYYLGVISEETKIDFLKRARLSTFLHYWPTPFNLSAIESLSYGTPIVARDIGFWKSLINGENGEIINNASDISKVFNKSFNQKKCYESVTPYSTEKMIESFFSVFGEIVQ